MKDFDTQIWRITAGGLLMWAIMSTAYYYAIERDPTALFMYGLRQIGALAIALPAMAIVVTLLDTCFPGRWFSDEPEAWERTVIVATLIFSVAYIVVFA